MKMSFWSDPLFEPSGSQPMPNANQPTFDLVEQELKDLTTEFLNNWDFSQVKSDPKKLHQKLGKIYGTVSADDIEEIIKLLQNMIQLMPSHQSESTVII